MKLRLLSLFVAAAATASLTGANLTATDGAWKIALDPQSKLLTLSQNGDLIASDAYATAMTPDSTLLVSSKYPSVKLSRRGVATGFGRGKAYTYTYSGLKGQPDMTQTFYVYPDRPYILVQSALKAKKGNAEAFNLCPLVSASTTELSLPAEGNMVYDMPWANDNWATFKVHDLKADKPVTSCEATALYNVESRRALVAGNLDHSTWKSAITVTPTADNAAGLKLESGYIGIPTWDIVPNNASSRRHGAVKGREVTSSLFMLGWFDDWRNGLETFGEANTVLCPKMEWPEDESLFGWQSWGGMEFGLNAQSAMSVLDYFEKELKPLGFANKEGSCLIVLDSGWNALNEDELRAFTKRCHDLGYKAGAYTTPFSYWGGEKEILENREWNGGRLGEMILKADGRPRHITGWSLDPTHPAVKEWNRRQFEQFRNLGFDFVKIDFMNNGSQEADSWYDPSITTGLQAFNYGMDYIKEFAGDMMLDYSIAPIFPAKAHVRRIGCDAWGDLPQSMYTLNCINGSWWLDRVYAFNDPDHMCMSKVSFSGKGSNDEREARIRYTCGLMTGMTLLGGTYAYEGPQRRFGHDNYRVVGYDEERERAAKFAANKDLTAMGQIGRSFRPVEGTFRHKNTLYSKDDITVDNQFVLDTPEAFYLVVFNYDKFGNNLDYRPDFKRIGADPADFASVKELWTGETFADPAQLAYTIPSKDVRIFRFEKK